MTEKPKIDLSRFDTETDALISEIRNLERGLHIAIQQQIQEFWENTGGAVVHSVQVNMIDAGTMAGADTRLGNVAVQVSLHGRYFSRD